MPRGASQTSMAHRVYEQKRVVGLGELVWDCRPQDRQLGGAPANFAVMAARLGDHGILASRLGTDAAGKEALDVLAGLPLDLNYLQMDAEHPTGMVQVAGSEPTYQIQQPAAWDFLHFSLQWRQLAESAHAVCFGTLAQRNPHSRKTIQQFLAATAPECVRIFDVNLRPPFWDAPTLHASLGLATIVKMNEQESRQILSLLPPPPPAAPSPESVARHLLAHFPHLQLVCITLGSAGSLLVTRGAQHRHLGLPCPAVDPVGAGDAFTAALVHYYLDGASLTVMNEAGNRWGAWVASRRGAIPPLDAATLAAHAQAIAAAGD